MGVCEHGLMHTVARRSLHIRQMPILRIICQIYNNIIIIISSSIIISGITNTA